MLTIFLAEELERTAKDSKDILFIQYFCDNKDEKRNSAVAIIRGMIFQLLQLRPKLIDHILPSFKIQNKSLFTASSFETLWRIFETMLRDPVVGIVYCILDGLDGCDEASLVVLLKKFKALFSTGLNVDKEVNDDIHRFIGDKINELSIHRQYPEPLRVHVEKVFQDRAQGTFLWIGIAAQELKKYKATEVEKALDLLPAGLDELILLWVVMAIRPLTLSELSVAIDVKPVIGFSRDEVIRDQVSYCGYFLTIKEDEGEVGLIHQSAKDYLLRKTRDSNDVLESFRIKEYAGNLEIARICFDYLQNGALKNEKVYHEDTAHLKAFPFLSYAVLHWHEHARSLACSEDIFDLSLPFYQKMSRIRESWLKTYWAMKRLGDLPKSFTLLRLASCFGILPLAENIFLKKGFINKIKRFFYVNQKDSNGMTALMWAAKGGHEAVVQLLLESGADIKAKDRFKGTALIKAAQYKHEAVVRLLLENNADTEAEDRYERTVLIEAAKRGHKVIMQMLLKNRANIEAKHRYGGIVLIKVT
ncbi:hypothetical protein B7463_g564, partial [Scytalidium lignicola]